MNENISLLCTFIDNLINEWGRIIILRTSLVQIPIINANPNCALFFSDQNEIGYPFSQGN
jgi:hypothetical protein